MKMSSSSSLSSSSSSLMKSSSTSVIECDGGTTTSSSRPERGVVTNNGPSLDASNNHRLPHPAPAVGDDSAAIEVLSSPADPLPSSACIINSRNGPELQEEECHHPNTHQKIPSSSSSSPASHTTSQTSTGGCFSPTESMHNDDDEEVDRLSPAVVSSNEQKEEPDHNEGSGVENDGSTSTSDDQPSPPPNNNNDDDDDVAASARQAQTSDDEKNVTKEKDNDDDDDDDYETTTSFQNSPNPSVLDQDTVVQSFRIVQQDRCSSVSAVPSAAATTTAAVDAADASTTTGERQEEEEEEAIEKNQPQHPPKILLSSPTLSENRDRQEAAESPPTPPSPPPPPPPLATHTSSNMSSNSHHRRRAPRTSRRDTPSSSTRSQRESRVHSKLVASGMLPPVPVAVATDGPTDEGRNSNLSTPSSLNQEDCCVPPTEFATTMSSQSQDGMPSSNNNVLSAADPSTPKSAAAISTTHRTVPSQDEQQQVRQPRSSHSLPSKSSTNNHAGLTLASGSGAVSSIRTVSSSTDENNRGSSSTFSVQSSPGAVYVRTPAGFRNSEMGRASANTPSWDSTWTVTEASNNDDGEESINDVDGDINVDDDHDKSDGILCPSSSRDADQTLLLEAIAIDEDDEQDQRRQQPPAQEDVEALVEERLRQREAELEIAEVTDIDENFVSHMKRKKKLYKWTIPLVILAITAVIVVAVVFSGSESNESDNDADIVVIENTEEPSMDSTMSGPTLDEVQERGYIRCGCFETSPGFSFHNTTTGKVDGFLVDICRALAMSIFGDSERYEMVFVVGAERFQLLRDRDVDILTQEATVTMGRDVLDVNANVGMTFSTPFHYTGMAFAGRPTYVDCADNLDSFNGDCRRLKMCIPQGSTHEVLLAELFPGPEKVVYVSQSEAAENLENGKCNVVVSDSVLLPESLFRMFGYTGPYKLGQKLFSKEPLSLVTRDGDPEWSKLANLIVEALYTAERLGVAKETAAADLAQVSSDLDDGLVSFILAIISTTGNMHELYRRHIEDIFPRQGLNLLNAGSGGLIYSFPFGHLETRGDILNGGVISSILESQKLRCGVSPRTGLAEFDSNSSKWFGLDIEFCVAVSAALFSHDSMNHIEIVELPRNETDRLDSLLNGNVDILAGEKMTLHSLWKEPESEARYVFSPAYFHDDNGASFALATLQHYGDSQWADFVFWVVMSTFYAEENGIMQLAAVEMPIVSLFGQRRKQMFVDTIWEVGNYGEIYNRTMESHFPRNSSRNNLNLGGTPQLVGLPLV